MICRAPVSDSIFVGKHNLVVGVYKSVGAVSDSIFVSKHNRYSLNVVAINVVSDSIFVGKHNTKVTTIVPKILFVTALPYN